MNYRKLYAVFMLCAFVGSQGLSAGSNRYTELIAAMREKAKPAMPVANKVAQVVTPQVIDQGELSFHEVMYGGMPKSNPSVPGSSVASAVSPSVSQVASSSASQGSIATLGKTLEDVLANYPWVPALACGGTAVYELDKAAALAGVKEPWLLSKDDVKKASPYAWPVTAGVAAYMIKRGVNPFELKDKLPALGNALNAFYHTAPLDGAGQVAQWCCDNGVSLAALALCAHAVRGFLQALNNAAKSYNGYMDGAPQKEKPKSDKKDDKKDDAKEQPKDKAPTDTALNATLRAAVALGATAAFLPVDHQKWTRTIGTTVVAAAGLKLVGSAVLTAVDAYDKAKSALDKARNKARSWFEPQARAQAQPAAPVRVVPDGPQ